MQENVFSMKMIVYIKQIMRKKKFNWKINGKQNEIQLFVLNPNFNKFPVVLKFNLKKILFVSKPNFILHDIPTYTRE